MEATPRNEAPPRRAPTARGNPGNHPRTKPAPRNTPAPLPAPAHLVGDPPLGSSSTLLAEAAAGNPPALATLRTLLAEELRRLPPRLDPADTAQEVWVRLLEDAHAGHVPASPGNAHDWLRTTVRRIADRAAQDRDPLPRAERFGHAAHAPRYPDRLTRSAEAQAIEAETGHLLRQAVSRLPGRCPQLLRALLCSPALTYREIATELRIAQGGIGPLRSRCLACLRRALPVRGVTREIAGNPR